MAFYSEGTFTTESREVAVDETWDSWSNPQSSSNVEVVDGSLQLAEVSVPDSVTSRPDDDNSLTDTVSDGLVVAFNSDFARFAVRISQNTTTFSRIRVYDYDSASYIYTDDISGNSAGDAVVVDQAVTAGTNYGVEIDNDGSAADIGYTGGESNYPYTGEDVDIVAQSRGGSSRTADNVRAINDIGNPDGVL